MHNIFLDKAHFGAYREDFIRSQLAHRPLSKKHISQYTAHATSVRIFLPPVYHSLDHRAGLNLPQ